MIKMELRGIKNITENNRRHVLIYLFIYFTEIYKKILIKT